MFIHSKEKKINNNNKAVAVGSYTTYVNAIHYSFDHKH